MEKERQRQREKDGGRDRERQRHRLGLKVIHKRAVKYTGSVHTDIHTDTNIHAVTQTDI